MKIAILPGDGIGPEITAQAVKVLNALGESFEMESADVGGAGYAAHGHPLPARTLALAKAADAVLFGAVGDYKYDTLERALRPGAGHPRPAQGARPVRQPASGDPVSGTGRRLDARSRKWCRAWTS